jgi:hypothetical protein
MGGTGRQGGGAIGGGGGISSASGEASGRGFGAWNQGGTIVSGHNRGMVNPNAVADTGYDSETIRARPGEVVLQRAAAEQLGPEVLAALNDPRIAGQIGQVIGQLLRGR